MNIRNELDQLQLLELTLIKLSLALKLTTPHFVNTIFTTNLSELQSILYLAIRRLEEQKGAVASFVPNLREFITSSQSVITVFKLQNIGKMTSMRDFCTFIINALSNFIAINCFKRLSIFSRPSNPLLTCITYLAEAYKTGLTELEKAESDIADICFIQEKYDSAMEAIGMSRQVYTGNDPIIAEVETAVRRNVWKICRGYMSVNSAKKAKTADEIDKYESLMTAYWDEMTFQNQPPYFTNHFPKMAAHYQELKIEYLVAKIKEHFPRKFDINNLQTTKSSIVGLKNIIKDFFGYENFCSQFDQKYNIKSDIGISSVESKARIFLNDSKIKAPFTIRILLELNKLLRLPIDSKSDEMSLTSEYHRELYDFKVKLEQVTSVAVDLKDDHIHALAPKLTFPSKI